MPPGERRNSIAIGAIAARIIASWPAPLVIRWTDLARDARHRRACQSSGGEDRGSHAHRRLIQLLAPGDGHTCGARQSSPPRSAGAW